LCTWCLVAIDDDNLLRCSFINDEMLCYIILFIFSIRIDVKLTPSGLWWTAYLFVWMGRRRAGLVDCFSWCVLEDSGSFLHLFCFVVSWRGSDLGQHLFYVLDFFCCWDIPFVGIYLWVDNMVIWKCMWYSVVMFYIEIFYACLVGELIEDVTSIS